MQHKKTLFTPLLILLALALHAPLFAQTMPDALPGKARQETRGIVLEATHLPSAESYAQAKTGMELNLENLLTVLEQEGVKYKEIVAAQAILETGHFKSQLCMEAHNLFGLRRASDGSYFTFDSWEESVVCYRDAVQYKYNGGDYYAFLRRIGYAEDRRYTAKVRELEKRYFGEEKGS